MQSPLSAKVEKCKEASREAYDKNPEKKRKCTEKVMLKIQKSLKIRQKNMQII